MNFVKNIVEFNQRVLNLVDLPFGPIASNVANISHESLLEEIEELREAVKTGDFIAAVDAIGDTIYFAVGAMYKHGICADAITGLICADHFADIEDPFKHAYDWCAKQQPVLAIPVQKEFDSVLKDVVKAIEHFYKYASSQFVVNSLDELALIVRLMIALFGEFGLPSHKANLIMQAIHEANMEKKLGVNAKRGDGQTADAVKPKDWIAPEKRIEAILDSM